MTTQISTIQLRSRNNSQAKSFIFNGERYEAKDFGFYDVEALLARMINVVGPVDVQQKANTMFVYEVDSSTCKGITKEGNRCKQHFYLTQVEDDSYCHHHIAQAPLAVQ